MSLFTSEDHTAPLGPDRRSMSPQDSAGPKREARLSAAGGFSLFPENASEKRSLSDDHNDVASLETRDPAQIEAALDALNQPRHDTSALVYSTPAEKKDTLGRAMSPTEGRKRTQYFEDQFSYKDGHVGSARDRIQKDSPVIAELRTNVIVRAPPSIPVAHHADMLGSGQG